MADKNLKIKKSGSGSEDKDNSDLPDLNVTPELSSDEPKEKQSALPEFDTRTQSY